MKTALYPGTFDPITNGHLDIIQRAAKLFGRIIIAVAQNPSKKPLFDLAERVRLVQQSVSHLENVEVVGFSGLLINLVQQKNADILIRGIRTTQDFEYELQLAHLNHQLGKGIESLFFPTDARWSYLSSTIVREVFLHRGDVSQFVPPTVLNALQQKSENA